MPASPRPPLHMLLWRHPSALLLGVQLIGIVVYPYLESRELWRSLFETAAILVLALVVRSLSAAAWVTWSAVALGLIAGALSIVNALSPHEALVITGGLLHAFLYFATAGSLLHYMLRDHRVTLDELFAVGATFTVLAWAFAYVYVVVQALQPAAFTGAVDPGSMRSWMELLFLSVTILTSTGLSDVVPLSSPARSMVMLEQMVGLGYVALVVSRVVGLTLGARRDQGGER